MSEKTFDENIAKICSEYGVKACIFTYINTERIINAIDNGAVFIGSHYYTPKYLSCLTK